MWVKLDKKEGRDCFLLKSLQGTIHHTLMLQRQKDTTALNIHCTHGTHTYIHIPTHISACTHVYGFNTTLTLTERQQNLSAIEHCSDDILTDCYFKTLSLEEIYISITAPAHAISLSLCQIILMDNEWKISI